GLNQPSGWQVLFFVIFLVLNSPMYFFLSHLPFVNVWFSSNVTPKMLENLLSKTKTISYVGCLVQCSFILFVHMEIFILAVMAFDRHTAIGKSLLYSSKMSRVVCIWMISFPYIYDFLTSLAVNCFYCVDPVLIKTVCAASFVKEHSMIILSGINFTYSLTVVIISYLFILIAILRMRSAEGRRKAFSTCGSHLTAVGLFYSTLIFMYLRHPTEESEEQGKMVAVFYTTVIPILRNKDFKEAMEKVISRKYLRK
uniref:G-protein coupled receptors family 1 profile domain-containing protein n=1 Tax=Nannospalax galili TaxID=1026970 RepID=A0A8C6QKF3_NANGA